MPADTNWEIIRSRLSERIRRRVIALQRLQGNQPDPEAIDQELSECGDDAAALWALAERVDRALDAAVRPRAARLPIPGAPPVTANHEFRTR
jgi:transposase